MKFTFHSIPVQKIPADMMQVSVSSREDKMSKERPFDTFYVILSSNYLNPLSAVPKWARESVQETIRAIVRDAARTARLTGQTAVELASDCQQEILLRQIKVNEAAVFDWLEKTLLPALSIPASKAKVGAKKYAPWLFSGSTLDRLGKFSELIAKTDLEDAFTLAVLNHISERISELSADTEDDLLDSLMAD